MARVLRNRAIPLDDPAQQSPSLPGAAHTNDFRVPLEETVPNETMTVDDIELEQEVKGLKALYKDTLGTKKKRKQRKAKDAVEGVVEIDLLEEMKQHEHILTQATAVEAQQPIMSENNILTHHPTAGEESFNSDEAQIISIPLEQSVYVQPLGQAVKPTKPVNILISDDKEVADDTDSLETESQSLVDLHLTNANHGRMLLTTPPRHSAYPSNAEATIFSTISTEQDTEDSFVGQILSRSPAKLIPLPSETTGDDSFVDIIATRSPAKPVSRIEDSVEMMDKLEEALEALDEVTLGRQLTIASPTKGVSSNNKRLAAGRVLENTPKPAKGPAVANKARKATQPSTAAVKTAERSKSSTTGHQTVVPTRHEPKMLAMEKTSRTRPVSVSPKLPAEPGKHPTTVAAPKKVVKRPTSLLPPKQPARSTKQPTRPAFELPGEAVARKLKEQKEARLAERVSCDDRAADLIAAKVVGRASSRTSRSASSLGRKPSVQAKKPLTKPTTQELPGEALSRRKREAHDARLKEQEEEERQRRSFKAKPNRSSLVPGILPRETLASLARRSLGVSQDDNTLDGQPRKSQLSKRDSVIVGAHRPLSQVSDKQANNPTTRRPSQATANEARKFTPVGASAAHKRATSVLSQNAKSREIYSRDAKPQNDVEREKHEREERARKSREDAAERGREASRKWAEQQKLKAMRAAGSAATKSDINAGGSSQIGVRTA